MLNLFDWARMRNEEKKRRSKQALHDLELMWRRRREDAIERARGKLVQLYFAGDAAADMAGSTRAGSLLYVPATRFGWKWMRTELLIPYHFTGQLIKELKGQGVLFEVHDAETNTWRPI
jgi:hypothetical protein